MQTDRRKELRDAYKSRRPDMGVVELRCTATGQRFLGITRNAAKELNSLRAKLNGGGHPNRPLQQLWSEHGENGFDFAWRTRWSTRTPKTSRPTTCKPCATCCWPKTPKPARSGSEPGASVDP